MQTIRFTLPADGSSLWAGYANLLLTSPDGRHLIDLAYLYEPPHGDSIHEGRLDGVPLPGLFWGCNFAFSHDSRYFAASWMRQQIERLTIVLDVQQNRYVVLPQYIYSFSFQWPMLEGTKADAGASYQFDGREEWLLF